LIDFRDFDQREHGMREEALKRELLEPELDQELVDYIAASLALQRYKRDVARQEGKA